MDSGEGGVVASTQATRSEADPGLAVSGEPADVRLTGVSKHYGEVVAVSSLDLEVKRGEFFTLLGPSGSGKTTTLRMIAGFEEPDTGRVELGGKDVTNLPPYDREVNTVFQDYALFPHMTVGENVAYGLRVKGVGKEERQVRLGLRELAQTNRVLHAHLCQVGEPLAADGSETPNTARVRAADRGHLDDLPLDQLDPISLGEDASLGHPIVLVDRESPLDRLDRHLRTPPTILSPQAPRGSVVRTFIPDGRGSEDAAMVKS